MKIDVSRIHFFTGKGPTKAIADIIIDDCLAIKGLRIIEGQKELFVGMPRELSKDGKWYDTVIPLTREARNDIETTVLTEFNKGGQDV